MQVVDAARRRCDVFNKLCIRDRILAGVPRIIFELVEESALIKHFGC